jgi:hypothetical protein
MLLTRHLRHQRLNMQIVRFLGAIAKKSLCCGVCPHDLSCVTRNDNCIPCGIHNGAKDNAVRRDLAHQPYTNTVSIRSYSYLGGTIGAYGPVRLLVVCPVIPPFLTGCIRRTYAAIFSFWAGVMPPIPMLGRSLL